MSYVSSNLMNDENVEYTAKIHWLIFVPGILSVILSFLMTASATQENGSPAFIGVLFLIVGIWSFTKALISKLTTELVVTNKRVIAKLGFIRRDTIELNHSKIESYQVNQPLFGRMLGYGTITINGTGGGKTPIRNIDSPLIFRKNAMQISDSIQAS